MKTASSGALPRRWKWWFLLAVAVAIAQIVRTVAGLHSWNDVAGLSFLVAVIVVVAAGSGWIATRLRASRIKAFLHGRENAHCWYVSDGISTRYLVVDADTVSLLTGRGRIEKTWSRDQVREAHAIKVLIGFPRPGLEINFGVDALLGSLDLVFIRGIFRCSREDALAAQEVLSHVG